MVGERDKDMMSFYLSAMVEERLCSFLSLDTSTLWQECSPVILSFTTISPME